MTAPGIPHRTENCNSGKGSPFFNLVEINLDVGYQYRICNLRHKLQVNAFKFIDPHWVALVLI